MSALEYLSPIPEAAETVGEYAQSVYNDFLLEFHSNYASTLCCFLSMTTYWYKITNSS